MQCYEANEEDDEQFYSSLNRTLNSHKYWNDSCFRLELILSLEQLCINTKLLVMLLFNNMCGVNEDEQNRCAIDVFSRC